MKTYPLRQFKHMNYAHILNKKNKIHVLIEYEDKKKIIMSTAYGIVNYTKGKK